MSDEMRAMTTDGLLRRRLEIAKALDEIGEDPRCTVVARGDDGEALMVEPPEGESGRVWGLLAEGHLIRDELDRRRDGN
jgi:hypothetical protein